MVTCISQSQLEAMSSVEELHSKAKPRLILRTVILFAVVIVETYLLVTSLSSYNSVRAKFPDDRGIQLAFGLMVVTYVAAIIAFLLCAIQIYKFSSLGLVSLAMAILFKGVSSLAYVIATTAMWGWYDSGALIPQLVLGLLYVVLGMLTMRLWRQYCRLAASDALPKAETPVECPV
jgi:hypothetical protein